jgi:flagellar hook assembly protein FlgD
VYLRIYDLLGREVRELVKGSQEPGFYRINWDGKNNQGKEVASGIYFYLLQTGDRKEGKKMLVIK